MNNNNNNNDDNNRNRAAFNPWHLAAGITTAIGAVAAAAFLPRLVRSSEQPQRSSARPSQSRATLTPPPDPNTGNSSYIDTISRALLNSCNVSSRPRTSCAPDNPVITNLNSLLHDIYLRYIKLKEFSLHYRVFDVIFNDLHKKMKDVDLYYRKYSSTVQFAGSHFDKLRIKKPDEFDMDIVIGLPLNYNVDMFNPANSDINLEAKGPGFVQLKMGLQFEKLPSRDVYEWPNNKAAYEWKDNCNYLLRSKFIEWFESVVILALNQYEVRSGCRPVVYVEGVPYIIKVSKSGPAMTLLIRNHERNFSMDVDLVPALRFPEKRWPISKAYRPIPSKCSKDYWMVVPKPNKDCSIIQDQMRSWRIGLHNQERELMYNSHNLKQTIRLMKKLRDSLEMKKIASYYIKTIFFWEIAAINNEEYWRNSPAVLFKHMVGKLHAALVAGSIPYYWNASNNLIGGVPHSILTSYANKLVPLINILQDSTQYKLVAKYLLTPSEFVDYNAKYLHI